VKFKIASSHCFLNENKAALVEVCLFYSLLSTEQTHKSACPLMFSFLIKKFVMVSIERMSIIYLWRD